MFSTFPATAPYQTLAHAILSQAYLKIGRPILALGLGYKLG